MASESRVKIVGQISGAPFGVNQINTSEIVNSDAPVTQLQMNLANGDNTITLLSTNVVGVVIIPDSTSTVGKTIKGNAADVGVPISKVSPTMLSFDDPPPASFIINASTAEPAKFIYFQFF